MVKVSIVVPVHEMKDKEFFLKRCLDSIASQTYMDYEIMQVENGKGMAANINEGIMSAEGEIVKLLFLDDYFAHPFALQNIVDSFTGGWLVTGYEHDDGMDRFDRRVPAYNHMIHTGANTIGSPSVLAFENKEPLLFDEEMSWMLDCDLYKRLYIRYGEPTILEDVNVVIGLGDHQTTHTMSDEDKYKEVGITSKRYE